jgi:zinc resistance-associated protein
MTKKTVIGLTVVIGVLALAAVALAGPGWGGGRGQHMAYGGGGYSQGYGPGNCQGYGSRAGYGPGYHKGSGYGPMVDSKFYEETAELRNNIQTKRNELWTELSKENVDAEKAKALQAELNTLRNEMSQKRLAAGLEFRKNNPDVRPYGHGRGPGRGAGPGYCWQ